MSEINRTDYKILKYIKKRKMILSAHAYEKFSKQQANIDKTRKLRLISISGGFSSASVGIRGARFRGGGVIAKPEPSAHESAPSEMWLNDSAELAMQEFKEKWFVFFVGSIIVPIVVAFLTTVVTIALSAK